MVKKLLISILSVLFCSAYCIADFKIEMHLDKTSLKIDEELELEIILDSDQDQFPKLETPIITGFHVAGGGSSTNEYYEQSTPRFSRTYLYMLKPKIVGTFNVAPVSVRYKGKQFSTHAASIDVLPKARNFEFVEPEELKGKNSGSPPVFIDQELDRDDVYIGEQVVYVFKLYTRINLEKQPSFELPVFKNISYHHLAPNRHYKLMLDKNEYHVTEVRYALIPKKMGVLKIPSARLTVALPTEDELMHKNKLLLSDELILNVRNLPLDGKNKSNHIEVGSFEISLTKKHPENRVGQPVELIFHIHGLGELSASPVYSFPPLPDFKIYNTSKKYKSYVDKYRFFSSVTFSTVIMPEKEGVYKISPFKFVYFDPLIEKYISKNTSSLILDIKPALKKSEKDIGKLLEKRIVTSATKDVLNALQLPGKRKKNIFYKTYRFWLFQSVPLILIFLIVLIKNIILKINPVFYRSDMVKKSFLEIEKYFEKKEFSDMYSEMEKLYKIIPELEEIPIVKEGVKQYIYSPEKIPYETAERDILHLKKILKKIGKIILIFIIAASVTIPLVASEDNFERGIELYRNKEYRLAIENFKQFNALSGNHEGSFYNIGNCYWYLEDYGNARYFWEQALHINPMNSAAFNNIKLLKDKIKESEDNNILTLMGQKFRTLLGIDIIIVILTILIWFLLFLFYYYFKKRRELFFWFFLISFILSIPVITLGTVAVYGNYIKYAVIVSKTDIFTDSKIELSIGKILPAGLKLRLLKSADSRIAVLYDSRVVWVNREVVRELP